METWFRLHFEPTMSIAHKVGVMEVTQLVRAETIDHALPAFMAGVLAMIGKSDEYVTYRVFTDTDVHAYVDTHESGMIGFWWHTPVDPEIIAEYVL